MSSAEAVPELTDPFAAVKPVVSRSAVAQVADQIVLAVREHRLNPGDRLPSERDLAAPFGVRRPTIRETLAGLELAGIVQAQKGRGTIVVGTSSHVAMWGVEVLPPEIFEARLAVEPELARLAAEKRHPEDIARLKEVLAGFEAEFAELGIWQTDIAIHRAIARAARNPILERALEDALVHTSGQLWCELSRRAFGNPDVFAGHLDERSEEHTSEL